MRGRNRKAKKEVKADNNWQPGGKFLGWIRAYRVQKLAEGLQEELKKGTDKNLDVESIRRRIYEWFRAERAPNREFALALVALSKKKPSGIGPLTLEDILAPAAGGRQRQSEGK